MQGTLLSRLVRTGEGVWGHVDCAILHSHTLTSCPISLGTRRKVLYQRAPRNIHRHVVLSEIKEAVATLPPVRN